MIDYYLNTMIKFVPLILLWFALSLIGFGLHLSNNTNDKFGRIYFDELLIKSFIITGFCILMLSIGIILDFIIKGS